MATTQRSPAPAAAAATAAPATTPVTAVAPLTAAAPVTAAPAPVTTTPATAARPGSSQPRAASAARFSLGASTSTTGTRRRVAVGRRFAAQSPRPVPTRTPANESKAFFEEEYKQKCEAARAALGPSTGPQTLTRDDMKKPGQSGWGQKPDTKLSSGWLEELKKSSQSIKKSSQLDATATVRVVSVDDQKCTLTDGDTEMSFELTTLGAVERRTIAYAFLRRNLPSKCLREPLWSTRPFRSTQRGQRHLRLARARPAAAAGIPRARRALGR